MVLLKAAEFNQATTGNRVFNLNDIADEAQNILETARRESEALLKQARKDIARDRQKAREEGYCAGYEQGMQQGGKEGHEQALQEARKEFDQSSAVVCECLQAICAAFDRNKNELLWRAEQNAVALIIAIARKVVKRAGLFNRNVAVENIKSALELLHKTTNVIVKVNPQDAEHLETMVQSAPSPFAAYSGISFEKDENIEAGGCRLITEQGRIDGQLDTQIDRIAEELLTTSDKDEKKVIAQAQLAPQEEKQSKANSPRGVETEND
jgi:flagellar assembly protein FliH